MPNSPGNRPGDRELRRQRGFALLIVLWALVFLALIVSHISATGRSEATVAHNLVNAGSAEAAADGAVYETVFRILDASGAHWPISGRHSMTIGRAAIEITSESEEGKINPNVCEPALLAAFFQAVGIDGPTAVRLGDAIADWREPGDSPRTNGAKSAQYKAAGLAYGPPGEPFRTIDELARVYGMTPEIMTRIRPYLSVYANGTPDPTLAAPPVLAALQRLNALGDAEPVIGLATVTITARASLPAGGGGFVRHAVVRLASGEAAGFGIAEWSRAAE